MSKFRKILACVLAAVLLTAMVPLQALAAEPAKEPPVANPAAAPASADSCPVIELGVETLAEVEGEPVYFQFTPEKSGNYCFYALSEEDTYGYLYDSEMNELAHDDDSGNGAGFYISYTLEAGVTYIWCARYWSSTKTGSFYVMLEKEHDYQLVESIPATCTEDGEELWVCAECGAEKREVIEARHDWEWVETKPATCTEDGEEGEVCTVCGKVNWTNVIPAEHTWNSENTCSMCGVTWTELANSYPVIELDVPTLVTTEGDGDYAYFRFTPDETRNYHFYAVSDLNTEAWLYDSNAEWLEYEYESWEDGVCDSDFSIRCPLVAGETYVWKVNSSDPGEYHVILEYAHNYRWTVTKAATCTEDGEETQICSECGKIGKTSVIPAGHDWEWVETVPATCTPGEKVCSCTVCGEIGRTEVIPAAHDWNEEDICSTCGAQWHYSGTAGEAVTWNLNKDGVLTFSGSGAMYDYYSQTSEESYAVSAPWLKYRGYITDIVMEEGITSIGDHAFQWVSNADITIASTVEIIGKGAFNSMTFDELVLPDALREIREYAFVYCEIGTITFPSHLETVGKGVFEWATIETVCVSSLEDWMQIQFDDFFSTPFEEYGGTDFYVNGVLTTEIIIPESVTEIKAAQFSNFSELSGVQFHDGVTRIGDEAFSMNPNGGSLAMNFTEVVIPASVEYIGNDAFAYCSRLADIYILNPDAEIGEDIAFKWSDITTTIHGYIGSTAQAYAEANGYLFEPLPGQEIASGWSGYTTWVLTADGTLTISPSGQTFNGKSNMKHYWKVGGTLTLPWSDYADQITRIVVEEGVDGIGQMAFYELPNLQEVVLADTVDEIYGYNFKNCKNLTTINLENVTYIWEGSFYGCTALENVTFAEGVEIEAWAFAHTDIVLP